MKIALPLLLALSSTAFGASTQASQAQGLVNSETSHRSMMDPVNPYGRVLPSDITPGLLKDGDRIEISWDSAVNSQEGRVLFTEVMIFDDQYFGARKGINILATFYPGEKAVIYGSQLSAAALERAAAIGQPADKYAGFWLGLIMGQSNLGGLFQKDFAMDPFSIQELANSSSHETPFDLQGDENDYYPNTGTAAHYTIKLIRE